MESWLGGGVLLLVAAALWLVYLVPNWLRRSEYLATERNAVRLQQTIRVLAETAEAPEAVRIENAAKARKAVAEALAARPVAVGTAPSLPLPAELDPRARAARRLRRTRLAVTVVMVAGVVVLGWQVVAMLQGGVEAGSAMIVTVAGLIVLGGAGLQGRLARAARERGRAQARSLSERERSLSDRSETKGSHRTRPSTASLDVAVDPDVPDGRTWTPQPLPQPLGQVRRDAALAAARVEALRIAAAGSAETERAIAAARAVEAERPPVEEPRTSHSSPVDEPRSGVSIPAPEASRLSPKIASPFAAMGVVDVASGAALDLESALARRRAS